MACQQERTTHNLGGRMSKEPKRYELGHTGGIDADTVDGMHLEEIQRYARFHSGGGGNPPKLLNDPDTTGWGDNQKGFNWFNMTEGRYKYWSGAAILTYPSVGGAGAPVDASYVTINAEDGLDGEVQHANIVNDAQKHSPKAHTLASHSTKAHTELTDVTADQHHAEAHSLASHSTKGHSELTGVGANDHHAQAHESTHKSGGADPFASTDLLESIGKRLQESSGPTTLTLGSIADGQYLRRSGAGIVGAASTGGGTYKLVPTYTIYKFGADYYAMDEDGNIDFGGSGDAGGIDGASPGAVIKAAMGGLTGGRTWQERVLVKGNISNLDHPAGNYNCIDVPSYTLLSIDGKMTLANDTNKSMIGNASGNAGWDVGITIEGGYLDGNQSQQTAGHGINLVTNAVEPAYGYLHSTVRDVSVANVKQNAFNFSHIGQLHAIDCKTHGTKSGGYGLYCDWVWDSLFERMLPIDGVTGGAYIIPMATVFQDLYINQGIVMPYSNRAKFSNILIDVSADIHGWAGHFFKCLVDNVHVEAFDNAAANKSAIRLTDDTAGMSAHSTDNIFSNVWCGRGYGAGTKQWKYGIEEADANQDYNIFSSTNGRDCVTGVVRRLGANSKADADTIIGTIVTV